MPLPLVLLLGALAASGQETRTVTCTFSNPRYSGYCTQTETAERTQSAQRVCGAVLACLNDIGCLKTYCNATDIRGGWQLVSAEDSGDR